MIGLGIFVRMLPGFGACCHYCAFGVADEILRTQHCIRELAQNLYLDGSLKLAGFDPLPSEMDRGPELELPPPALQICGLQYGRARLPAEYHKLEKKAAHLAESFDMVRQRWLQFQETEEESTPSLVKRRRSDEPMERSPAAGGCAPGSNLGASESEVHLLSVNCDSLEEGIIKDVSLPSELKGL